MNRVDVSIVIPTHNRRAAAARTLHALAHQCCSPAAFEVILVADGCTDDTAGLAAVEWPIPVRVLEQPHGGPASARNRGAAAAAGDLLIFLDDDIEVVPGFVSAHVAAHVAPGQRRYRLPPAGVAGTPRSVHGDAARVVGSDVRTDAGSGTSLHILGPAQRQLLVDAPAVRADRELRRDAALPRRLRAGLSAHRGRRALSVRAGGGRVAPRAHRPGACARPQARRRTRRRCAGTAISEAGGGVAARTSSDAPHAPRAHVALPCGRTPGARRCRRSPVPAAARRSGGDAPAHTVAPSAG